MKRIVLVISLLLGLSIQAVAAKDSIKQPADIQLAALLIQAYAGEDDVLNKEETQKVLAFLRNSLPEPTGRAGMSTMLNRQNVIASSARGDMTEERESIRSMEPEHYVGKFISKYDKNEDTVLNRMELTNAMAKIIGLPSSAKRWSKRAIANR